TGHNTATQRVNPLLMPDNAWQKPFGSPTTIAIHHDSNVVRSPIS
ncbi:MAG: hypothetical protein ACJA2P_001160, partial [Rhodoferax sp.]